MVMLKVYNRDGNVTGEMELPKILQRDWNPVLVHQVAQALLGNSRKRIADTKDRAQVSGGGKKPWNQKGTGRARHGSIRSPIWKGGGVTHGPLSARNFTKKINKKMVKAAMASLFSKKAVDGELKVVEMIEMSVPKTKLVAALVRRVTDNHSAVVLAPKSNKNLHLAARNLKGIAVIDPLQINVLDILNHRDIVVEKSVLENYGK